MDYAEPRTRQEKKGKKDSNDPLYSQKRVRQLEALIDLRASKKAVSAAQVKASSLENPGKACKPKSR